MHSLTFITALVSATAVAGAGLPPHGHSFLTTHRPSTPTAHATGGYSFDTTHRPSTSTASHIGRQTSSTSLDLAPAADPAFSRRPKGYSSEMTHRPSTSTAHATGGYTFSTSLQLAPTKVNAAQVGPTAMTITIMNQAGVPLSTTHGVNTLDPLTTVLPTVSLPGPGILANGGSHTYVLPLGHGSNLGVAKGKFLGDESLVEYTFENQDGINKIAIDVSYVTGFTFSIKCSCSDGTHLSGCTESLWAQSTCEQPNGEVACKNPLRASGGPPANPFFQKCQGKAYTFSGDHPALKNGGCGTGSVTCTILPGGN